MSGLAKAGLMSPALHDTAGSVCPTDWSLPVAGLRHLTRGLAKQAKRFRKELKRCQGRFSAKAVHASRVSSRRLLSTVELLAALLPADQVQKIRHHLKTHLDTFNELRDTQVQQRIIKRNFNNSPAARSFQKYLRQQEKHFTKKTRKHIRHFKFKKLEKLLAAAQETIESCAPNAAKAAANEVARSIDAAYAQALALRQRISPSLTQTIHATRISFKRFRYMVEAVQKFLPATTGTLLSDLHAYQDMMGEIQDIVVLLEEYDRFLLSIKVENEAALELHERLLRRRSQLVQYYLANGDQLLTFWPAPIPKTVSAKKSSTTRKPSKKERDSLYTQ